MIWSRVLDVPNGHGKVIIARWEREKPLRADREVGRGGQGTSWGVEHLWAPRWMPNRV